MTFHVARARDWQEACEVGEYRVSTGGRSLDDEGFVHCSADRAPVIAGAQSSALLLEALEHAWPRAAT